LDSINVALNKGGSVASEILHSLLTVVLIIETPIQRYRVLKTAIRQEKTMYNRCSIFLVEHHWHLVFDWHYIWDKGKDIR